MNLCKVQDRLFVEIHDEVQKAGKMDQAQLALLI